MTNSLKVFSNDDFTVRTIQDDNGKIWFVAKDVAEALEYSETSLTSMNKLCEPVPEIWKGRKRFLTPGGEQDIGTSNEFGTWRVSKSRSSNHECPTFVYNDKALAWFRANVEFFD